MSKYMGAEISEYRWRAYPSKTFEEIKAFEIQNLNELPYSEKNAINKLRNEYVGKIQSHRLQMNSNFDMLKAMIKKAEIEENNAEEIKEVEKLLREHLDKEENIDNLSTNKVFRSLKYTENEGYNK